MKLQILSRKLIKPAAPTPLHLRTYKLSFFDQLAPPLHWPLIFFYPATHMLKSINRHQELQKSLSETLTLFYPLAGRYVKDDFLVDCNDQGVAYMEAQVNCQLNEFLEEGPNVELLADHFVPWDIGEATLVTSPMVCIQATVFECGGLALTLFASHVIADGFTASTFMHGWATASRLGISKVICPSFGDTSSLFPARVDLSGVKPPPPKNSTTGANYKIVTRRFLFDGEKISTLKAKGRPTSASSGMIERDPSKVEVVTASIWKALINVDRAKHGNLRTSVLSFPIGLRGRPGLATPDNSFGNFYMVFPTKFIAEESKRELHHLVGLFRDTVRSTLADVSAAGGGDVFSMAVKLLNEIREGMRDERVDVRMFTSLCRFGLYEADFGWGKPCRVSLVAVPFESYALLDTKCGTGIEAWVRLNEMDMLQFQRDPDIIAFTSSS